MVFKSCPSKSTAPFCGFSKPKSRRISVDFPQPVRPTSATYSPGRMRNDKSSSTMGMLSLYRKDTWLSSTRPDSFPTGRRVSSVSGWASRMGLAISSTGRMRAADSAMFTSDRNAPDTMP